MQSSQTTVGPQPQVELDPLDDDPDEPLLLTEVAPPESDVPPHPQGGPIRFTRKPATAGHATRPDEGNRNGNGQHDVLLLTDPLDPPPATRSPRQDTADSSRAKEPSPQPSETQPAAPENVPRPTPEMISAATRDAVDKAFSSLVAESAAATTAGIGEGQGDTLEDLVRAALRPVLRQWLDQHLPQIVQSIVEREIARLSANRS